MPNTPLNNPLAPKVAPPEPPPVPTMTSASLIPKLEEPEPRTGWSPPDELAEDITALPLGAPDFAIDIKPYMANPNIWPRWIFTDRRRYAQARAQGWRNCKKSDLKPGYAHLTPFETEGGTKYINGDLILMVMDRKIYLGALRYKHQVAAALSDAAMQRRVSQGRAQQEMGATVNAVNSAYQAAGQRPPLEVFTPDADASSGEFQGVMTDPAVASKELGRIAPPNTHLDMGTLASLAKKADEHK